MCLLLSALIALISGSVTYKHFGLEVKKVEEE